MSKSSKDVFVAELRTFADGTEPRSARDTTTIDAAFARFEPNETRARSTTRWIWIPTAAVGFAATAAVALALLPLEPDRALSQKIQEGHASAATTVAQEASRARLRTGMLRNEARDQVLVAGEAVPEGVSLVAQTEDTCVDVAAGEMCFWHDSRFELDLSQLRIATIEFDRGHARVKASGQDGHSIRMRTKQGQLETEAGEFAVEGHASSSVVVIAFVVGGVTYTSKEGVRSELTVGERVRIGDPVDKDFAVEAETKAEAGAKAEAEAPGARNGSGRASAKTLLEHAQSLRAAGKLGRAAVTYEKLAHAYPSTSEGRRAMLSLGELELTRRGRPLVSLRWLDRYLQSGDGLLAQEARFLRIRALRELGSTAEERRATETFIKHYPRSPYTTRLKQRLPELEKD